MCQPGTTCVLEAVVEESDRRAEGVRPRTVLKENSSQAGCWAGQTESIRMFPALWHKVEI
jgi:hypothetical protein